MTIAQKKAIALAESLNEVVGRGWDNGRDFSAAFDLTLRNHGVNPDADPTYDIRHVSKSWWVRFDGRLAKWRAIESEKRPPLIAMPASSRSPFMRAAAEAAKSAKPGEVAGFMWGDSFQPVIVADPKELGFDLIDAYPTTTCTPILGFAQGEQK